MLEVQVDFRVEGGKSSEGDGRTAADIEAEMARLQAERSEPSREIPVDASEEDV